MISNTKVDTTENILMAVGIGLLYTAIILIGCAASSLAYTHNGVVVACSVGAFFLLCIGSVTWFLVTIYQGSTK
jgi:hypothetical protein